MRINLPLSVADVETLSKTSEDKTTGKTKLLAAKH